MDMRLSTLRGESPPIAAIRAQVVQLIARQTGSRRLPPVLILGETGTGKGLLARTIHEAGTRSTGPFVDINCAAIPEPLLEAELFGYERGAFTDARQAKPGLFQTANGGTLFLDEIGLLPASVQGKLLTVLEDRKVRRLGGTRAEPVDVALMAATSVDLKRAVGEHRFREDLYHRLAVITLELPPLRVRGADIVALAEHFLARACADYGQSPRALTPEARHFLATYRWPGNVRELANAMERVVLLSDIDVITPAMLVFLADDTEPAETVSAGEGADPTAGGSLDDTLRTRIEAALRETGGSIRRTAITLGIARNTLRARMDKYGLRQHDAPAGSLGASRRVPPRWERRHLAFFRARLLFPSTTADSRTLDVIAQKVESFGGQIEESGPAGVVAVFGLEPVDNAPTHAALAALAVQRAAGGTRGAAGHPSQLVIAIDCADHLVARVRSTFQVGVDGKAAARSTLDLLVADDTPGVIAVSGAAVPFLARRFVLEGPRDGREAWMVRGRRPTETGGSTAGFVGRSAELEILRQAAARAERGQGQIVAVVGEAGVGKSRLLLEAVRPLHRWHVLACGGAPYATNASYFPIVDLLKRYCHVEDTDTAPEVRDKIVRGLPADAGDPARLLSPILDLCGLLSEDDPFRQMDPAQRRRRTHEAIKQVLLAASGAQPLCLIVEDLHWIDSETLAVLDLLGESITASRVLLLVNYRPEHQRGWGSRTSYTQIRLDLLPAEGTEELLVALLGADPSLAALTRTLIERTEGNPFFIEECVRTLVETGVVVGAASSYRLGGLRGDLVLPPTVQAVIAARVDRLSRDDRSVLHSAAAIGQDVPVAILRAITDVTGAAFDAALASLSRAELMHETRAYPDSEYGFKHALTHEVVYDSLLPELRRALHARIVDAIERLHGDRRLAEHVEQLVYHGARGELWEKTARYAHEAGLKALDRSAHVEAIGHADQGLEALRALPDTARRRRYELDLQITRGSVLAATRGFAAPEVEPVYTRARALCEEVGEPAQLLVVLRGLTNFYLNRAQLETARELAERRLHLAQSLDDPSSATVVRIGVGVVAYHMGDFRSALGHFEPMLSDAETSRGPAVGREPLTRHPLMVNCLSHAAWSLWFSGAIDQSLARSQEALALARELGQPFPLTNARYWAAQLSQYRRERSRTRELAEAVIATSAEEGFAQQKAQGVFLRGWALAEPGGEGTGWAQMREGFAAWEATGAGVLRPYYLALLAEVAAQADDVDEGVRLIDEALVAVEKSGERSWQAEVHRIHGELLLRQAGDEAMTSTAAEAAHVCFQQALGIARDQQARSLELRAAMSLGRLWHRVGMRTEANELLAPICRWFTEGADTVDLREARALLGAWA
jgi:DNA-binding NtrC family response regulator/predicted ATPase